MIHLPEELSTGVFGLIILGFRILYWRQKFDDAVLSADAAVDLHVQGNEHAVGDALMEGLDSCGVAIMIQQSDRLVDQRDRGFIEHAVERDGSVPIHLSGGTDAEVII